MKSPNILAATVRVRHEPGDEQDENQTKRARIQSSLSSISSSPLHSPLSTAQCPRNFVCQPIRLRHTQPRHQRELKLRIEKGALSSGFRPCCLHTRERVNCWRHIFPAPALPILSPSRVRWGGLSIADLFSSRDEAGKAVRRRRPSRPDELDLACFRAQGQAVKKRDGRRWRIDCGRKGDLSRGARDCEGD
jgi:hypothetical protein